MSSQYVYYKIDIENEITERTSIELFEYMKKEYIENNAFLAFEDALSRCYELPFESSGTCIWIEYERDMICLSKQFPDIIFCLQCEPEYDESPRKEYYKNGKRQICYANIIYPEYDESKLK